MYWLLYMYHVLLPMVAMYHDISIAIQLPNVYVYVQVLCALSSYVPSYSVYYYWTESKLHGVVPGTSPLSRLYTCTCTSVCCFYTMNVQVHVHVDVDITLSSFYCASDKMNGSW